MITMSRLVFVNCKNCVCVCVLEFMDCENHVAGLLNAEPEALELEEQ